jgi:hypothetical protein
MCPLVAVVACGLWTETICPMSFTRHEIYLHAVDRCSFLDRLNDFFDKIRLGGVVVVEQPDLSSVVVQSNVDSFFENKSVPTERVKVGSVMLPLSACEAEGSKAIGDDRPEWWRRRGHATRGSHGRGHSVFRSARCGSFREQAADERCWQLTA